jgi:hypothetical protein
MSLERPTLYLTSLYMRGDVLMRLPWEESNPNEGDRETETLERSLSQYKVETPAGQLVVLIPGYHSQSHGAYSRQVHEA